jgi:hypothetical protein
MVVVPWDEYMAASVADKREPASVEDTDEGPPRKKAKTNGAV